MLTVEAMTGKAEQFFANNSAFPNERFPIVTVRDGKAVGGFCYFRMADGTLNAFVKKQSTTWVDSKSLAEMIEFPFYRLGAHAVITVYDGSATMKSFYEKIGAVFCKDNPKKMVFTRDNVLKAAKVLRGEV